MRSSRDASAIVAALALLAACVFGTSRSIAQETVLELGPEIELPGAPNECCEAAGPSVAWDGTAFVILWHEYRGGYDDLPISEHLMGARLGRDGSYVDGATELGIEGCAVPGYAVCDGHERCAFSCGSAILEQPWSQWLALTERLEPVWSAGLDHWAAVAWDGTAFVAVQQSHDATVPVSYIDPDAPALIRELDLPPLPEEYVPRSTWANPVSCQPFPAGEELLVFCRSGGSLDERAAMIRIAAGRVMSEWQELPTVPLILTVEMIGEMPLAAWVEAGDEDSVLRLGVLDEDGLSESASVGSDVTWAAVVALGQGAAVAFVSDQDPWPALPATTLSLAALAGHEPSVLRTVARDLPGSFAWGVGPGARNDVSSSGDTIALGYELTGSRENPIRIRLASGALRNRGSACDDELECASGFCVDSVCCESACREPCAVCNQDGGGGLCRPEPLPEDGFCDEFEVVGGGCECGLSHGQADGAPAGILLVGLLVAAARRFGTRARTRHDHATTLRHAHPASPRCSSPTRCVRRNG